MERIVYLDTHVVAWLYAGTIDLFPSEVRSILEKDDLLISPIVLLELQYLQEIGWLKAAPEKIIGGLQKTVGLNLCRQEFSKVVQEALTQDWTRDPFDPLSWLRRGWPKRLF